MHQRTRSVTGRAEARLRLQECINTFNDDAAVTPVEEIVPQVVFAMLERDYGYVSDIDGSDGRPRGERRHTD